MSLGVFDAHGLDSKKFLRRFFQKATLSYHAQAAGELQKKSPS
jgi:hypothetical protein